MSIDHPIGDPTGGPAYRELRDPVTAIAASAGANVLGSVIGGQASKSAANKQSKAAQAAAAYQQQTASEQIQNMQNLRSAQNMELQALLNDATIRGQTDRAAALQSILNSRNQAMQTFQPYMQTGQQGLSAIQQQLPYFQQQFGPEQFKANLDPGYEFMKQQGLGAIRQGMNVGGGGSNIDRAATKFAQDYANTGYQNAFNRFTGQQQNIYNRLAGIAGIGQTATGQAAQTGLGYEGLGAQVGLGYDQLLSRDQLGFGQTMAQFNQGMGANIANLATGGAAATAQGITGSAQASAAGDVGMANAFGSGLSNLGNMGMQYAMFNTPAMQKLFGNTQTGGTGASQIFNNPAGLDASIDYTYKPTLG
jgi:hypothetical protein